MSSMQRGKPLPHQDHRIVTSDADIEGGGPTNTTNQMNNPNYSKDDKSIHSGSTNGSNHLRAVRPPPSVVTMDSMSIGAGAALSPPVSGGFGYAPTRSGKTRVLSTHDRLAYRYLTSTPYDTLKKVAVALLVGTILCSLLMPRDGSMVVSIMMWVYAAIGFGVVSSLYLSRSVLSCDDGTEEMRAVSDPIREGAEGFLRVQYTVRT